MTKAEMIKEVSSRVENVNQTKVDEVLAAYADVVIETLAKNKDEKITLPALGTFSVKYVPERSGIAALAGGKAWTKPAHDELQFKIIRSAKELA